MRKIDVFFYGLFMDEQILRGKGVTPTNIRSASVSGFRLLIGKRATLVPDESGRVYGLVASLSHDDIDRLYSDPTVQAYRPEAITAQLFNGGTLAVLCFNLIDRPAADEHDATYASKLKALAEKLNFPAEYVASITARPHERQDKLE